MSESNGSVVVIGGTAGLGRAIAEHYAARGREVFLTGRSADRAATVAAQIGGNAHGIALDLTRPHEVAAAVAGVGPVAHLVIGAIDRDENSVADYDIDKAIGLVTVKLVGYAAVVSALLDRLGPESSTVLFGGMAKDRPYPGSTTVTTINGGVSALVRTLVVELRPRRFNAIHPAVVGDHPYWMAKPPEVFAGLLARTPTARLVATSDIVHAVVFLLENPSVNGIDLRIDGGWRHM